MNEEVKVQMFKLSLQDNDIVLVEFTEKLPLDTRSNFMRQLKSLTDKNIKIIGINKGINIKTMNDDELDFFLKALTEIKEKRSNNG